MPTIKENLEEAIRLVEEHEEQRIDLAAYRRESPCGTIYCTAGLLASDGFFQRQGMNLYRDRLLSVTMDKLDGLFGTDAYRRLFASRHAGLWDEDLEDRMMSDKDLALARLEKQLELYK